MGSLVKETSCQILVKFSEKELLHKVQTGDFYVSFIHNRKGFVYLLKIIITKEIIYNLIGKFDKKRKYKKGGEKLLVSIFDYLKTYHDLIIVENSPIICGAWEIGEFLKEEKAKKNYISLVYEKTDSEEKLLDWLDMLKGCLSSTFSQNHFKSLLIKFLNNG